MRRAHVVLVAGALLTAGAPAAWLLRGDAADFGEVVQPALAVAVPRPADGPVVATRSARLGDVANVSDPPVSVRLGAGAPTAVDPVGLDADRLVEVPADVSRAGWYQPGSQPGDLRGATVLVGHVDDEVQGLGAFAVLRGLDAGDEVRVRTTTGRELLYDVVARQRFDKTSAPLDQLFTVEGAPRLVLISCDGAFDRTTGSYEQNVVVTAVARP